MIARSCRWAKRASAVSVSMNGSAARRRKPDPGLTKEATMTTKLVTLVLLLFLTTGTATAQELVTAMTKDPAGVPSKDVVMFTVQFPPGWADPVHRHDGQGFIYVLEGSIVMQVKGGQEVTLT